MDQALAEARLEILGYAQRDFASQPDQMRVALIRIEARSHHNRTAALRQLSGLGLIG